jgi:hypothetical protein
MADKIDPAALSRTWVHSHEEDAADTMVFRPSSYKFPPSRGRRSFQLKADGSLVASGPGPDDRTVSAPGVWKLENSDTLTMQPAGKAKTSMKILSAEPTRLVVKKD